MSLGLDDLKYFLVVCDTLNVTRASEILGITQPTLSYSIKRLEKELGFDLFIRLKNGVRLTKLGEDFFVQGQKVLFEWEQAQKIVKGHKDEVSGHYTIGLHSSVALYSLEHFLPNLTKKYPLLNFDFKHGLSREITEQVVSWKTDFGIVVNPKEHPDLVIFELCKDTVTLFSHKKKYKNILVYDPSLVQTNTILKKLKNKYDRYMTSSDLEVIAKLVALGEGIGIMPERVAKKYKDLVKVKGSPVFKDRICLIYRVEKQKTKAAREIISAITQASI